MSHRHPICWTKERGSDTSPSPLDPHLLSNFICVPHFVRRVYCFLFPTGISEGSLGSPEPQNLSLSPYRAVSPEVPCPPAASQEGSSHFGDNHASSLATSQSLPRDLAHSRCSTEQPSSRSFPLHNHSFNQCLDNSNNKSRYWDGQSHHNIQQVISTIVLFTIKIYIKKFACWMVLTVG